MGRLWKSRGIQARRSVNEKDKSYEVINKVVTNDVLVGGDFNGHVGSDMGGIVEVHWGFGIWQINHGGTRLMD